MIYNEGKLVPRQGSVEYPSTVHEITPRMFQEELATIDARAEAATPGPWELWEFSENPYDPTVRVVDAVGQTILGRGADGTWADVDFAAHARTDVSRLTAALREARALVNASLDEAARMQERIEEQAIQLDHAHDHADGVGRERDEAQARAERAEKVASLWETCAREMGDVMDDMDVDLPDDHPAAVAWAALRSIGVKP
jgi:hypothetical protein